MKDHNDVLTLGALRNLNQSGNFDIGGTPGRASQIPNPRSRREKPNAKPRPQTSVSKWESPPFKPARGSNREKKEKKEKKGGGKKKKKKNAPELVNGNSLCASAALRPWCASRSCRWRSSRDANSNCTIYAVSSADLCKETNKSRHLKKKISLH